MAVMPHCVDNDKEKNLHMLSAGAVFLRLIFQPWLPREPWGMWVSLCSEFHRPVQPLQFKTLHASLSAVAFCHSGFWVCVE